MPAAWSGEMETVTIGMEFSSHSISAETASGVHFRLLKATNANAEVPEHRKRLFCEADLQRRTLVPRHDLLKKETVGSNHHPASLQSLKSGYLGRRRALSSPER